MTSVRPRGAEADGSASDEPQWCLEVWRREGVVPVILALRVALTVVVLVGAPLADAQPANPTPLRNLVDDQVVVKVGYCKGEYTLTLASGARHTYPEFNLRFKTDSSRSGPEPGKPALLGAGMRGDRAQVIFAGLEDLKRFLVEQC